MKRKFITTIAALLFIMVAPMFAKSATYKVYSSFKDPYGQIHIENTDGSFSIITSLEKIPTLLQYFHPEIKACYDKNKGEKYVEGSKPDFYWYKWFLIYDIWRICSDEDTSYALLTIDDDNERMILSFWSYLGSFIDMYHFSFNAAYTYFMDFYNGWYFGY